MPRKLSPIYFINFLIGAIPAFAGTYYLDAAGGSDAASGLTQASAWKSLTHVNKTTFKAGDSILFKSTGMWSGELHPKGSGTVGKPIVIATFGNSSKAVIDGGGMTGQGVLYLEGQSNWDIGDLEITNDDSLPGDRRGVDVVGPAAHIRLHDLYVHNIKGIPDVTDGDLTAKATGGMGFTGGGQNFLIENCVVNTVDNTGIFTDGGAGSYPNLQVRNNDVHDIAKNAMIIRGADSLSVIEHNVCYMTCVRGVTTGNTIFSSNCRGTTFQYNEGYLNNSTGGHDGSLYDCDINGGSNTKWQYSYSHDNSHGLMWFCSDSTYVGIKVRYNVSQNDKGNIFCFSFNLGHADIYNNTVYIGPNVNPAIIYEKANKYGYSFYNNIIYNKSNGATYHYGNATRQFDYNVFYGNHPTGEPVDKHALTSDPMFVNPGSGTIGIQTVNGYQLQSGSPSINSGMIIADNGGKDYLGNPIYQTPDRGAFEWQGTSAISTRSVSEDPRQPVGSSSSLAKNGSVIQFIENKKIFNALGRH